MTPTERRHPVRTCVGCRRQRPQASLLRVVAGVDGRLLASRVASGRGAWLCADDACTARAMKTKAFQRALRRPVDDAGLRDQLASMVTVTVGAGAGQER